MQICSWKPFCSLHRFFSAAVEWMVSVFVQSQPGCAYIKMDNLILANQNQKCTMLRKGIAGSKRNLQISILSIVYICLVKVLVVCFVFQLGNLFDNSLKIRDDNPIILALSDGIQCRDKCFSIFEYNFLNNQVINLSEVHGYI